MPTRAGGTWPHSARRTRLLVVVGAVLLVGVAVATSRLVAGATDVERVGRDAVCEQFDVFVAASQEDGLFSTQTLIRSARKLSQQAERYVGARSTGLDGTSVADAGDDIRTVIGSVAWETPDLVAATRPIALECGWTWPISARPPASSPTPPLTSR